MGDCFDIPLVYCLEEVDWIKVISKTNGTVEIQHVGILGSETLGDKRNGNFQFHIGEV